MRAEATSSVLAHVGQDLETKIPFLGSGKEMIGFSLSEDIFRLFGGMFSAFCMCLGSALWVVVSTLAAVAAAAAAVVVVVDSSFFTWFMAAASRKPSDRLIMLA